MVRSWLGWSGVGVWGWYCVEMVGVYWVVWAKTVPSIYFRTPSGHGKKTILDLFLRQDPPWAPKQVEKGFIGHSRGQTGSKRAQHILSRLFGHPTGFRSSLGSETSSGEETPCGSAWPGLGTKYQICIGHGSGNVNGLVVARVRAFLCGLCREGFIDSLVPWH